ncbi:MAG: hypothetical protein AB7O65_01560 [Candidatus Korobacteraceae bacterium]
MNAPVAFEAAEGIRSAAGNMVVIPPIAGDGVNEIRDMRGEILRANIAKALEGSYLHMKTLFDYAGLWQSAAGKAETEEPSLAALLLDALKIEPERDEERELSQAARDMKIESVY